MAQMELIVGVVVLWGLLLAVGAGLSRARKWRTAGVTLHGGGVGWRRGGEETSEGVLERLSGRPLTATFLVLGVGVLLGAIIFAAAIAGAAPVTGLAQTVVIGGIAFMLATFLVAGIYTSARARGLGSAGATAFVGWAIGGLLLIAVVLQLTVA